MRFLLLTALLDLRRRLADPAALLIWIGIPVLIGGLMALISSGGDGVPKARILLVDEDESLVSGFLAGLGQGGMGEFLDIESVSRDQGLERMDAGKATALLVLPQGLQQGVLGDTPSELLLVTNPAQRILPGMVEEGLEMLVEAVFYLQRLMGEPLRQMAQGPPPGQNVFADPTVAALSVDINQRIQGLEGILFPAAITVEDPDAVASQENDEDEGEAASGIHIGRLFLPGILFMSVLFIVQGMGNDIWTEQRQGTLRRVLTSPQPVSLFLAGKLLASTLFAGTVALVALALGVGFFDLALARVPLALVWCGLCSAALFSFFLLLELLTSSPRAGNLVSTLVVFPLMMIGGSMFPFEAMPDWMAALGQRTPNGLAVVRLKEMLFGQPLLVPILLSALAVGVPAVCAFLLCLRRLRGRFATG